MEGTSEQMVLFITAYGIKVIGAIIILILGRIAAGIEIPYPQQVVHMTQVE